jgi:hypothetical protein
MKTWNFKMFMVMAAVAVSVPGSPGDTSKVLKARRITNPPVLDGRLDDSCWINAPLATDFKDQFFGTRVTDKTFACVVYDSLNIYVSFQCLEAEPEKIVALETRRDGIFENDDHVVFVVDPFHAHLVQYRSCFMVNANGVQCSEIAGGRATKTEWKGDWRAAAARHDSGWNAELVIPFTILDYPSRTGPQLIGLNFKRRHQHQDINAFWANIGPQNHTENDGHWDGVVFPKKQKPLSILGYAFAGMDSLKAPVVNGGLNLKYQKSSDLTFVTSVNPDFSNVEQEVESIDFSYRERYYPDHRPFFQEGGDIIRNGSWDFYSRRVPQFDLGLKAYGKSGRLTFAGLNCTRFEKADRINTLVNTTKDKTDPVKRNDLVLATKMDVGRSSVVPVQYTRYDRQGRWGHSLSIRPDFRWNKLKIGCAWVGTQTPGDSAGSDNFAHIGWDSPRLFCGTYGYYVTPEFELINGLVPYNDAKGGGGYFGLQNEWRKGFLKRAWCKVEASRTDRINNDPYTNEIELKGFVHFRKDFTAEIDLEKGRYEEHRDWTATLELAGNADNQYNEYGINASYGRLASMDYRFVEPFAGIRLFKKLSLIWRSQFLFHEEEIKLHMIEANFDFTSERCVNTRLVYQAGKFNGFIAYRQTVRKGMDAYVIIGDPNADEMRERVLVKIVVPLV